MESDTAALTRIGRKTLALREAAELLAENQCLRGTIEALKERLMRAETEVGRWVGVCVLGGGRTGSRKAGRRGAWGRSATKCTQH